MFRLTRKGRMVWLTWYINIRLFPVKVVRSKKISIEEVKIEEPSIQDFFSLP